MIHRPVTLILSLLILPVTAFNQSYDWFDRWPDKYLTPARPNVRLIDLQDNYDVMTRFVEQFGLTDSSRDGGVVFFLP